MNKTLLIILGILLIGTGVYYLATREVYEDPEDPEDPVVEEIYITGEIHSISEDRILVAEHSRGLDYTGDIDDLEGDAIWVNVTENTDILDSDNNLVLFEELEVGMLVQIWVDGVILESYPAHGTAERIVVLEEEEVAKECFIGGCSGEICSDDPEAMSTCELLPGMECLDRDMSCELVEDRCTWVLSEEAAECFLEVMEEQGEEVAETRIGYFFDKAKELID